MTADQRTTLDEIRAVLDDKTKTIRQLRDRIEQMELDNRELREIVRRNARRHDSRHHAPTAGRR